MRKLLFLVFITLVLISCNKGEGMAVYNISTLAQLQAISPDHLADDCVLLNNIDASATEGWNEGLGFEPIGTYTAPFTGSFDGQYHTIDSLYISRIEDEDENIGLFGLVETDKEIKRVGLTNVDITGSWYYTGALIGQLVNDVAWAYVSECYSTGIVATRSDGGYLVGGLIGSVDAAEVSITDCYSTVAVSGDDYIGGLIGENCGQVANCYASGNVTENEAYRDGYPIGGLVGYNWGALTDCFATGVIDAGAPNDVGGFCGENDGSINNCWFTDSNYDNGLGTLEEGGKPAFYGSTHAVYAGYAGTIKIGARDLEAPHKLRIRKGGTTYGIPLLTTSDPDASLVRIYDGAALVNLILEGGVSHNCSIEGNVKSGSCPDTYDENPNTAYVVEDHHLGEIGEWAERTASITSEHTWSTGYYVRRALLRCYMKYNWLIDGEVWLTAQLFLKYDDSWHLVKEYTHHIEGSYMTGSVTKLFDEKAGWNNVKGIKGYVKVRCKSNEWQSAEVQMSRVEAHAYTGEGAVKALPIVP